MSKKRIDESKIAGLGGEEPTHKFCPTCETEKPINQFYNFYRSNDGRQHRCKTCQQNSKQLGFGQEYVRPDNAVPGRTYCNGSMKELYVPEKTHYRNQGNAHIKSVGF